MLLSVSELGFNATNHNHILCILSRDCLWRTVNCNGALNKCWFDTALPSYSTPPHTHTESHIHACAWHTHAQRVCVAPKLAQPAFSLFFSFSSCSSQLMCVLESESRWLGLQIWASWGIWLQLSLLVRWRSILFHAWTHGNNLFWQGALFQAVVWMLSLNFC